MWRRVPPYAAVACWGAGALVASTAAAGEDAGGAYAVAHDLDDAEVASLEPLLNAGGGRSDPEGGSEGGGSVGGGGEVGVSARRSHHLHHYPDEGSVCPRAATAALCEAARVEGATFLWGTAVTSLLAGPSAAAATSATAATTEVDTDAPPDTDAPGDTSATGVTAARAIGVRATDGQGASFDVRADVVVLAAGVGLGRQALGASVPMLHSPGRLVHLAPRTAAAAATAAATTTAAAMTTAAATTAATTTAGVIASAADDTSTLDSRRLSTLFVDTLGGVHALQRADGTCVVGGDLSGYAMHMPCVCHALP